MTDSEVRNDLYMSNKILLETISNNDLAQTNKVLLESIAQKDKQILEYQKTILRLEKELTEAVDNHVNSTLAWCEKLNKILKEKSITAWKFFTTNEELEKITGLTQDELWNNDFDLDDWDFGFQTDRQIVNTQFLNLLNSYCVGYQEFLYKNKYYYIVYHA